MAVGVGASAGDFSLTSIRNARLLLIMYITYILSFELIMAANPSRPCSSMLFIYMTCVVYVYVCTKLKRVVIMAREGAAVYTESLKKTRIQHLAQIDDHVERHHGVDLSDGGNSGLLNTIRNQNFYDLKAVFFMNSGSLSHPSWKNWTTSASRTTSTIVPPWFRLVVCGELDRGWKQPHHPNKHGFNIRQISTIMRKGIMGSVYLTGETEDDLTPALMISRQFFS